MVETKKKMSIKKKAFASLAATMLLMDSSSPAAFALENKEDKKEYKEAVGTLDTTLPGVSTETPAVPEEVENKQSLTGESVTRYVGDALPELADFKASATDSQGQALEVTLDATQVDMSQAGTYDVLLSTADGQSLPLQVTVEEQAVAEDNQSVSPDSSVPVQEKAAAPSTATTALPEVQTITTGTWGTSPTSFDSDTGILTVSAGGIAKDTTPGGVAAANIKQIVFEDGITFPSRSDTLFKGMTNLTDIVGLNTVDTSHATNMNGMFQGDSRLTSLDLSSFNTSQVTDMGFMFAGMKSLVSLDLSNFDTSQVTYMAFMIAAEKMQTLDISSFDMRKVTNRNNMLSSAFSLNKVLLGPFTNISGTNLPESPSSVPYLRAWTRTVPVDPPVSYATSAAFMAGYKGSNPGTYERAVDQSSLTGDSLTRYVGDEMPADSDFNAKATDVTGAEIGVTIDKSKVNMDVANTYNVTITADDGQKLTVTVTVLPNLQSLTADSLTRYVGDDKPADADFNAKGTDKDGNDIPAGDIAIDTSAVDMYKAGTYDVIVTSTDGQTYTATVTVKENQAKINGSDVIAYVGDPIPDDASFNASATDIDGNPLTVTFDKTAVDMSKVGSYDVILTAPGGLTKTVQVHVLVNQQSINGSDVTAYVGDAIPADSDFNASATGKDGNKINVTLDKTAVDMSQVGDYDVLITADDGQTKTVQVHVKENLQSLTADNLTRYVGDDKPADADFNAKGTDKDGNPIPAGDITIDTSVVDMSKAGTYDVIVTSKDGQTYTATVTVKENLQSLTADNLTRYVGDDKPADADFNAKGTDKDGNDIPAGDITIDTSAVDMSKAGTYDVIVTSKDGQKTTVTVTVIESKQSLTADSLTRYVGDDKPADADFNAKGTDIDGNPIPAGDITIDTSAVDMSKAGTYDVIVTSKDGQTYTATVTVKENLQSLTADSLTRYVGDDKPTDADFNAKGTDKDGNPIPAGDITIDTSAVDMSKAGTYDVIVTSKDGQTYTATVTVKENLQSLTADSLTRYAGDAKPADADFNAKGTDKDGNDIPAGDITIDTSAVDMSKAGTYDVIVTSKDGQTYTATVTVKENLQSLTADSLTRYAGDAMPADADFNAKGTDKDGNPIPAGDITIDTSAVDMSKAGTYDVIVTSKDGQTYTATVTVKNLQSITGSDVIAYVGDDKPTDADFKASATDVHGNPIPAENITIDTSAVDMSKVGTYDVIITTSDGQTLTVKVIVKNLQSITGSDVTAYVGDAIPADTDFKASATDVHGNPIGVTIDTSAVDMSKVGTYEVLITAADGQTLTVKVIVKDLQSITGSSVLAYVNDPMPADAEFKASATDVHGNPIDVTLDKSQVDMSKVGIYDVLITAGNPLARRTEPGQSLVVQVIVIDKPVVVPPVTPPGDKEPTPAPVVTLPTVVVSGEDNNNLPSDTLPATGERGTLLSTLFGGGLLGLGAFFLARKRKKDDAEDTSNENTED